MSAGPDQPGHGDTIVAIATAPGTGAVGLIRLSGVGAITIAAPLLRMARGVALGDAHPRVLHRASVVDPVANQIIDEALVAVMPGPRSYTGENVVEISCHGNPIVLADVVRMLVEGGARLAEPGEFTRRAFLSGRIDLMEAEAVALLIEARSARAAKLAIREMSGALSAAMHSVRERLLGLVAGIEVALDFPDDEVGVPRRAASAECRSIVEVLKHLSTGILRGRSIYTGLTAVIVGAPNVGKSSLLNALLGRDRAIVSPVPGTTRDLVEGETVIGGVRVRLVDGAGLGDPKDEIDAEGMRRTRRAVDDGDVALVVLDRSCPLSTHDKRVLELTEGRERIVIANKSDMDPLLVHCPIDSVCSALTGEGLTDVRERLSKWVQRRLGEDAEEFGIVASLRVVGLLDQSTHSVERAIEGLDMGLPLEAVLVDLHAARKELEHGLGLEADEALLDSIFATFCVGK